MSKIGTYVNKLTNPQKIICLILILSFILLLAIGIPTLARFKNRNIVSTVTVWDGSVAERYKKGNGTEADPYIISNGSELAYFYTQLSSTDYENTYFALSNDIVLNKGIFNYDSDNGIQYVLDDQTFYVEDYSNKYYNNASREGTEIGTINIFHNLDGFKGHFDGRSFRIFGLYLTNQNSDELALFTNLEGDVHDLYVENSIIHGGTITAGIASITNNATLSNILLDGYVIGRNNNVTKTVNVNVYSPVMYLQDVETTNYLDLSNNIPFVGCEIISTSITGNYVINGGITEDTTVKINGEIVSGGSFEVNLGNNIMLNIPVTASTTADGDVTLELSNLNYNINYKYTVTAGVVANASNTTIKNVVNKADIYSYFVGAGLVGVTTNSLNISQSYNIGDINSNNVAGGLIGVIEKSENNIVISKSYNTGDVTSSNVGGLIGILENNTSSISVNKVFNTSNDYSIGTISNTTINVNDAYYVNGIAVKEGVTNGNFSLTSVDNLNNKNYVINNLSFNEFMSFEDLESNSSNVWIFEEKSLPILFIDDLNNPIARINANIYSWNNLSYDLGTIRLDSNITFNIEATDELEPLKEIYYYVSNSKEPLSKEEILQIDSWVTYNGIVQILDEGAYVIYVKLVNYNDNVSYINTDLLILDLTGSDVSIRIDANTWTTLRENLGYVYINRPKQVTVEAEDDLSGISSVKYYITDEVLNINDLNSLPENDWVNYSDAILIDEIKTHLIYVRVIDNFEHVTYVNSDYIVLDGYNQTNLIIGRDSASYSNADFYITNKSTITLDIAYSSTSMPELNDHTHNLISNILLPLGTKITLIDRVEERIYEYQIPTDDDLYNYNNSCDGKGPDCTKFATYPFTLFKEVGTGSVEKYYIERTYYNDGSINEDFSVVLDLSNTNVGLNYNDVVLYIELHDSNGINVRPTLHNTLKQFNIYSKVDLEDASSKLYLTTDYSGEPIIYNSNSSTDINLTSGINYKFINGFKIIDTTFENKNIGLSIKMVDSNGNIVDKEHLKNIIVKIDEKSYYPEEDNIIHINLKNGIEDVTKVLTVITSENNSSLRDGMYYLNIQNYASYDGYYYDDLGETEVNIPIFVSNNPNIEHSFDVLMNDENHIINKNIANVNVSFDILQNGDLENPNIRISLYKKDLLTAYNQDYSIVDLREYVSNTLNSCEENIYYVIEEPILYDGSEETYNNFKLNLITANFENTGYKFVFNLHDGNKKIGTIEKYFIVK